MNQPAATPSASAPFTLRRGSPNPLALEQRLIFDADVAKSADTLTPADHDIAPATDRDHVSADDASGRLVDHAADRSVTDTSATTSATREIVFIDTSVTDWHVIAANVKRDAFVILLDPRRDGLDQVRQAVAGFSDLAAIHIVSHGAEGTVRFGSSEYHSGNLSAHADTLAAIGNSLAPDADILLYGCDVARGADGLEFIGQLARATSADIAASSDATGHAAMDADWTLEQSAGSIETSLFLADRGVDDYANRLNTVSLSGKAGWTAVMFGSAQDPQGDSQAKASDTDIVGGPGIGSFYVGFNDNGTATESDDQMYFRLRIDNPSSPGSFGGVAVVGMDVNGDGRIDIFITVDARNNGQVIQIMDPGTGLNTSPSTTSTTPIPAGWLPNGGRYGFTVENYATSAVTSATDPHWTGNTDAGNDGKQDSFVSWRIPVTDLAAVLAKPSPVEIKNNISTYGPRGATGIAGFNKDTVVRYVSFTQTQPGPINADLNGVGRNFDPNAGWDALGAFTEPMSPSNPVSAGPRVIISDPVSGDNVINLAESSGATISGTSQYLPNKALVLTITDQNNVTVTANVTTDGAGNWSATGLNLSGLADGTLTVTAVIDPDSDAGTDNSLVDTTTVVLDRTPPALAIATLAGSTSGRPTLTGTSDLPDGTVLTVNIDHDNNPLTAATLYQVVVSGGVWTLNLATATPTSGALPLSGLTSFAKVTATGTDTAGNTTTTTLLTRPGVKDLLTSNLTPTVSGTWANIPGDTLSVTVNGVTYSHGQLTISGNTWSVALTNNTGPTALVAGQTYEVAATVTRGPASATDYTATELEIS
ncbi:MAG: DUF4347 domain-containing protein, partial [Opitutaceae bacterium]|nr:DUF4347 domain-containing protein [Opitutaceae bacterium]